MSTILEVSDLNYTFSQRKGLLLTKQEFHLGPINFSLNEGQTIAIIGNNGSGKSLIAKTLVGAVKPKGGMIKLLGTSENHVDLHSRTKIIRMIFQHNADVINPGLSIGSILMHSLNLHTQLTEIEKREKIEDTLIKVGLLREHYYFYRHMLSDGQQQRVAMARALILDPKIIVADEPFAALDPSVRSQTVNLILKLQQELGLGFVFISHNMGIVRHISDKVLVIDNGKIIEQGDAEQVLSDPQQAVTQKLVQSHYNLVEKYFEQL